MADWRARAACRGLAVDLFFPVRGTAWRSIAVCESCPVRQQCLTDAMAEEAQEPTRLIFGTRGGMTADARRAARRRAEGRPAPVHLIGRRWSDRIV